MMPAIVGASLLAIASCAAWAQTPALSFEVASVKPAAPSGDGLVMRRMSGGPGSDDPGTLTLTNVPLKLMVVRAYDLKQYQVEGPDWIDSIGYDVTAKLPPGTTKEQFQQMLQTLLAERFKLTVHRETRQLPVYALVVAKGGPKMKEVETPAIPEVPPAGPGPGPLGMIRGRGGEPPRLASGPGVRMMVTPGGRQLAGYMTMAGLANALSNAMDRAVVDQTELKATYDVNLTWTPDELEGNQGMRGLPPPPMAGPPGGGEPSRAASEPGLSLPQALQETLGLKLEARKSSAEMLIIDHADKVPVEN
jgi:uncharacterized protein (TIGR03435 family)